MSSWAQGRELTRQSWAILKENRGLTAYPLIGTVFGVIPFIVLVPGVYFLADNQNWIGWALIVVGIYLATLVASLFQAGLVVSAAAALDGKETSFGHGMGAAFGRLGVLSRWAFVSTLVTLLISALRGNNNAGLVEVIFRNVLAAAAGIMWQLITFFVMPAMMLDNLGLIDAIKKSASTFKQRWGTQLSGGVRIGGLIGLLVILPAMLALIVGVMLTVFGAWPLGVPLAVIGFVALIIGGIVLGTMRGIFSVVLYRYATTGAVAPGFTEDQLAHAVSVKS